MLRKVDLSDLERPKIALMHADLTRPLHACCATAFFRSQHKILLACEYECDESLDVRLKVSSYVTIVSCISDAIEYSLLSPEPCSFRLKFCMYVRSILSANSPKYQVQVN